MAQVLFETCIVCSGDGLCRPCKATGKSGFFLHEPPSSAPACWWCKGSGRCRYCRGMSRVRTFTPQLRVRTSLDRPTSITLAAFTGAGWRTIPIPAYVLRRSLEQQRGWVRWRAQTHYRDEGGVCFLFGNIVGYRWEPARNVLFDLDRTGRLLDLGEFRRWLRKGELS